MMKYVLVLLTACLMSACAKNDAQGDSVQLQKELATFNSAFETADVDKLHSMITENYVHTNGEWKAFGKSEWLGYMEKRKQRIESGELVIDSYQMTDLKITMNNASAFVTGKVISEGSDAGVPFKTEIRVSNYWLLENGQWKRAGFHDTRIESD